MSLPEFKLINHMSDSEIQEIALKKIAPLIKEYSYEINNKYEFDQPMTLNEMKYYLNEVTEELKKIKNP